MCLYRKCQNRKESTCMRINIHRMILISIITVCYNCLINKGDL